MQLETTKRVFVYDQSYNKLEKKLPIAVPIQVAQGYKTVLCFN